MPAAPTSTRRLQVAWWLVPAVVTLVAVNQWRLATREQVSPWVGAGFGMFATVDGSGRRLVAVADGTPIEVPQSLHEDARRAAAAPHPRRLARLASLIQGSIDAGARADAANRDLATCI